MNPLRPGPQARGEGPGDGARLDTRLRRVSRGALALGLMLGLMEQQSGERSMHRECLTTVTDSLNSGLGITILWVVVMFVLHRRHQGTCHQAQESGGA